MATSDGGASTLDHEDEAASPRFPARSLIPILSMMGLVGLLHFYIGSRIIGRAGWPAWGTTLGWTVMALLFVSVPLSLYLRSSGATWAQKSIVPAALLWIGSFGVLLTVTVAADVARIAYELLARGAVDPVRVGHIEALGILGSVVPLIAWSVFTARGKARVERVKVPIANLPAGLEGLRIVQISDVHVGDSIKADFLARVVAQVNALNPDVVAITGDLVDGSVAEFRSELKPLADLRSALGAYYVTGNHEYYWGAPAWEAEVKRLGVTVLKNEHRLLERNGSQLALGGVTDFNAGHFGAEHASRPDLAFAGAPTEAPRVLLAHQPRSAEAAAKAGVALQLSGHTHGGQIFPFNFFVRLQQPTVRGLDKVLGFWIYTHRGTGYWGPPMRLGPAPEIAELTLTRAV